jgi:hypothetical protein
MLETPSGRRLGDGVGYCYNPIQVMDRSGELVRESIAHIEEV